MKFEVYISVPIGKSVRYWYNPFYLRFWNDFWFWTDVDNEILKRQLLREELRHSEAHSISNILAE